MGAVGSATLTLDMLRATMRRIEDETSRVCEHVVHPKAESWTICAQCYEPLHVRTLDGNKINNTAEAVRELWR